MTNREKIKLMDDDELSFVLMCPYDTVGEPEEITPCVVNDDPPQVKDCCLCIKEWLAKEAAEER